MKRILFSHTWLTVMISVVVLLAILSLVLPSTMTDLLTKIAIMILFATSINIMVGYGGMMPIGQAMFLGFGSYAYGLLILRAGLPFGLAFMVALILCLVLNAIIGYLCLKGTSMTFGLLHIAFNIWLYTIVNKFVYFTGGNSGIGGIPRPEYLINSVPFFLFVAAIVFVCLILIRVIIGSQLGKMLQGLRENEERLIFLGIDTRRFQLVVFIIAGLFTGVAGILLAMLNSGIYPVYLSPLQSAQGLMMCLVGGMYNFWGPSLGAVLVTIIGTEVSNFITQWQGILGVIIVGCAIALRGGILRKRTRKILFPEMLGDKLSPEEALNDTKSR